MAHSPKQQAFITEYLVDRNGTQAAIRAGYSPKTANEQAARLLANVSIRAEVDKATTKAAEDAGVTKEWLLRTLKENVENATKAENHSAVNQGVQLGMKHLGMLVEKVDHTTGGEKIQTVVILPHNERHA